MSDTSKNTSKERKKPGAVASEKQRPRMGANALVSVVGAAVILLAVNYLAMRHYARADWTSAGIYTLSDKSLKVVRALQKDVSMHVLWSAGDPTGRFEEAKELLDRYAAASPRLKVEIVDPDLNPERVQLLIQKYGARLQQDATGQSGIEAGIFVVSGDNVKFVSSSDFEDFSMDMMGMGGESEGEDGLSGYKAEQSLTSAVMHVTSDEQSKICFTQGHGEWAFEGFGGRAVGHLKEGLTQDGYKVEAITTAGASKVPTACDAVVVVGPERAFLSEETALLQRYVAGGGKLLLFLDPLMEESRFLPTGLESLTAQYGIKLSKDLIFEVDPRRIIGNSPLAFVASEFSTHDAVKHLSVPDSVGADVKAAVGAYPVAFSTARSLQPVEGTEVIAEVLAKTSAESWGEVDLASLGTSETPPGKDQYDTQGPAPIAMAATLPTKSAEESGGRLVVVGDSDVLSEELIVNAGLYNRDFFSGIVGWLSERSSLISIAPKNPEHIRLNLTEDDLSTVTRLIWGEVIFFVVLGIIVWLRRRS